MKSIQKSAIAVGVAVLFLFVSACMFCVQALEFDVPVFAMKSVMTVLIDAGHGGVDGGVSGRKTGIKESDVNLAVSLALKDILEDAGFAVVLTRKTEAGLYDTATKGFKKRDMKKRREIILEAKPDLVVSVHQNFYPTGRTRGAQVFYLKKDERAKRLAQKIQKSMNGLYEKEGVKPRTEQFGEYYILECSPYTSVIVECGFLSNLEDEKLLGKQSFQKKLAEAIARGVTAFVEGEAFGGANGA
jgi:N-acetylmuramoyl-L-alanine amidase